MRAHDVELEGFYWYFPPGEEVEIVQFHLYDRVPLVGSWGYFDRLGMEDPFTAIELPGQMIGPITYADCQGRSDEPA